MCCLGGQTTSSKLFQRSQLTVDCWQRREPFSSTVFIFLYSLPGCCRLHYPQPLLSLTPPWPRLSASHRTEEEHAGDAHSFSVITSLLYHGGSRVPTENLIDSQKYKHSQLLFNATEWEPIRSVALARATRDRRAHHCSHHRSLSEDKWGLSKLPLINKSLSFALNLVLGSWCCYVWPPEPVGERKQKLSVLAD